MHLLHSWIGSHWRPYYMGTLFEREIQFVFAFVHLAQQETGLMLPRIKNKHLDKFILRHWETAQTISDTAH